MADQCKHCAAGIPRFMNGDLPMHAGMDAPSTICPGPTRQQQRRKVWSFIYGPNEKRKYRPVVGGIAPCDRRATEPAHDCYSGGLGHWTEKCAGLDSAEHRASYERNLGVGESEQPAPASPPEPKLVCVECGRRYDPEGWDPMGGDCPVVKNEADGQIIGLPGKTETPAPAARATEHKCFYRTVEREGRFVTECETCRAPSPVEGAREWRGEETELIEAARKFEDFYLDGNEPAFRDYLVELLTSYHVQAASSERQRLEKRIAELERERISIQPLRELRTCSVCRLPIELEIDVFRCYDCKSAHHLDCLKHHIKESDPRRYLCAKKTNSELDHCRELLRDAEPLLGAMPDHKSVLERVGAIRRAIRAALTSGEDHPTPDETKER